MFLKKIVFPTLIFFLFFSTNAQNIALDEINVSDLKKHLAIIASDSLMGRQIGTDNKGLEMAAGYIKNSIEKIGLNPINGSFFQPFSVFTSEPDFENSFLSVFSKSGEVLFIADSIINLSNNTTINIDKTEVIFAGYHVDRKLISNPGAINIDGKVVMMMAGDEKSAKNKRVGWDEKFENEKIKVAFENGAKGVILVCSPLDIKNEIYSRVKQRSGRISYDINEPHTKSDENSLILIPANVADKILGGEGKLETLLNKKEKKNKHNFQPDLLISIQSKRLNKEIKTKNIVGVVEGSDPDLKDECVVLMAHYDHLGVDANGDVYNGADDNGSGVVTLLEVAEAMVKTPQKPKRSVLFLWVSSEEIGLYGSQYYTSNPLFSIEKTVTCINIDMDGRVYEPRDSVWKDSPKRVKDFDGLYTLSNETWPGLKEINSEKCRDLGLIPDYSLSSNFLRSSDHFNFHDKGVPILNLATGYHFDYHKPTDEISRINFEKMKRVADLCYLVAYEVANKDVIEF